MSVMEGWKPIISILSPLRDRHQPVRPLVRRTAEPGGTGEISALRAPPRAQNCHQRRHHQRLDDRQPRPTVATVSPGDCPSTAASSGATARHGLHQRLDDRPRHRLHQAPLPPGSD